MKSAIIFPLPLMLLLAAGPASPIKPGKWEVSSTPIDIQLPNEPGNELLKHMIGRTVVSSLCVTPTNAQKGVLALLNPGEKSQCRSTHIDTINGRIDGEFACPAQSGGSIGIVSGTYTFDHLDMTMTITIQNPRRVSIKTHAIDRYVGPC